MRKLIMSGSWDFETPATTLMDIHSRGVDRSWMQKRAAVLTNEIGSIRPETGRTHIHLIAMGSTEAYGPNRNADGFSKSALLEKHSTFVTNGHVFKNHKNKDPKEASGVVKFSSYNEPMSRVELVVAVDNAKWANELEKLASGQDVPFSMACRVPFDVCSICGNQAPSREQYCGHMKKMAGQIMADGRQVYVDNPDPTFFDISGVFRPADRIAYSLQKVASACTMTGVELAEEAGLFEPFRTLTKRSGIAWRKRAALRKLSDIEKQIEAMAPAETNNLRNAFTGGSGASGAELDQLSEATKDRVDKLMGALGQVRVSLPLREFIRIVMGNEPGVSTGDVERRLPGIFSRLNEEGCDDVIDDGTYDPVGRMTDMPSSVRNIIGKMVPELSLGEEPVGRRMSITIIRQIPKPKMLTGGEGIRTMKVAAEGAGAELVAREYAKYKLAFLTDELEKEGSQLSVRLGVLQNYLCL